MEAFCLSGKELNLLMESVLDESLAYRVKVMGRGYSMSPFIKDNSVIIIKPVDSVRKIKFGDIIAAFSNDKTQIIVHRVVGLKKGHYLIKGDNKNHYDGWFQKKDILGVVDEVLGHGLVGKNLPYFNTIIAMGSKSGIFNRLLFPVFRWIKKMMRNHG